jgi:threonine synthase
VKHRTEGINNEDWNDWMRYISTRDQAIHYSASQAIAQGLAKDGGLLTPIYIPKLPGKALEDLKTMSYQHRAVYIMKQYLEEFTVKELSQFAEAAYSPDKFDTPAVAPVHTVDGNTYCLELWHGPTCAFKDMALQMLPHLLTASLTKTEENRTACILVATSGDTGKGALEGFRDVPHTRILVFYPKDGVSQVQELQMVTQEGNNVGVTAVHGNFDDAQTGVKRLFSDEDLREKLNERGFFFSSANSINWGRVLPQIVYYVSAYCDLLRDEKITLGQTVNVCVPTGNFGNILAAYYAQSMGVPIGKLICASNSNNVLTEFIRSGFYDRNRTFYNTISPSMDILISSNLERMLYSMTQDVEEVKRYMEQLSSIGRYQVRERVKERMQKLFEGFSCDDDETKKVIRRVYEKHDYLIDPHTAVAFSALEQYRKKTNDDTPCLVVSTASPFKFCDSVLQALGEKKVSEGLDALDQLTQRTGCPAPTPLASLRDKKVRFTQAVDKENMVDAVLSMLV